MKSKLLLFSTSVLFSLFLNAQKAEYNITFESVWNGNDHGTLPSGAHWSRLVGATHKTKDAFLAMGQNATTGVKNIAETGGTFNFKNEVDTAITSNEADQYLNGSSLGRAAGTITLTDVVVQKDFPRVSLLSMIAPSPDWIIAVNGVNLLNTNGTWKNEVSVDLFAYDAGTDSGTGYTSSDQPTNPVQTISSLKGVTPFGNAKIGTMTFTLSKVLSISNIESKNVTIFYNSNTKKLVVNAPNKIKNIEIYSINGRLVKKLIDNYSINELNKGIYIVKLTTNKGVYAKKILKM